MDDQQFRELLHRFGLSWNGYRKVRKGVKKRIRRHMQQLRCQNVKEYFGVLESDEELRRQWERLMTVSISRFFRDRGLWQSLEDQILPYIINKNKERVNVWAAGCACGEEVYTFKILWDRLEGRLESMPDLEIWATDLNPVYLAKARDGIYSRSSLREVPEELRSAYFKPQKGGGNYVVTPSVKKGIWWKVSNLLDDPPEADFHLIFLRNNLLTYYNDEVKEPAFRKVIDRLIPGSFLIIGSHEKIPFGTSDLRSFSGYGYIFEKTGCS